jgi:hypothetical protein
MWGYFSGFARKLPPHTASTTEITKEPNNMTPVERV